ncbi:MAG: FTR1 family iron permease [Clostridiales Family XIII bacterium]|jgi:high-affinity iron transporter|nr:FTR1 family iron permease [Clostridiales Family XIII bacterium]
MKAYLMQEGSRTAALVAQSVSARRVLSVAALAVIAFFVFAGPVAAAETAHESWNDVVDDMEAEINAAYDLYAAGDVDGGKAQVDVAYYSYYEKLGFEKTVMAYISGDRAAKVEYQFSFAKKAMTAGESESAVRESLDELTRLLREDASTLDGETESAGGVFVGSLVIITREGFEAIIIVGAIIAYLVKSGNAEKTRAIYVGCVVALAASVALAVILNILTGLTGANQEIIEGVTMLIAVAVLFWVSNWMVSKADADAWRGYIEGAVKSSVTKGSVFSLAFAAFLAVFREGAETILFYQALLAGTDTHVNMIWIGLAVGGVILVVVYLLIRFLSIRIPLKPFFLGTSILLFIISISFIGAGVKELQEGNVVGVTPVQGIGSVDILGVYPTVETLVPQSALLVLTVVLIVVQLRKQKRLRQTAKKQQDA